MASFRNGPVEIAYLDEGEGEPIVLIHGFASTKEINWVTPGWVAALTAAGRRAIALDNRGHGASSKLYDPLDYDRAVMADDVRALLDHLGLARADVMGYSMGARIAANLTIARPDRVRAPASALRGRRWSARCRSLQTAPTEEARAAQSRGLSPPAPQRRLPLRRRC